MSEAVDNRNEVNIDLEKYMSLVEKLDGAEDTISALKTEAEAARKQLAPPKRKIMDLFLDDNDINEKSIIGFMSFFLMFVFGTCDLITAFWGMDLQISDTIYTSFVVVTLGAFGISEAGKAFGKYLSPQLEVELTLSSTFTFYNPY